MDQHNFDYDSAMARMGGRRDVLMELATRFVDYCPERVLGLREAARNGDVEQALTLANLLRGVLAALSADEAHAAARELAMCCATRNVRAMQSAAGVLIEELRVLERELRGVIKTAA
jgi:HPt (histidine-containing phosphotransfer) domain-containing protein